MKSRIVSIKGPEEVGPKHVSDCVICNRPLFDKEPCDLINDHETGDKKIVCKKCIEDNTTTAEAEGGTAKERLQVLYNERKAGQNTADR